MEEQEEEEEPEDVYVYPKWSAYKQEKFNREQKLAKLQDEHNVRLENYELKYPDPPEWYCPLLNTLEKRIKDETVSSSQWTPGDQCPKDKYEEYKKQIKERTHGGVYNDAISKQMVHQWRQRHAKWYLGKQKLKEKLRKEFHVACSTTYSTLSDPQLNEDIVQKWKENIRPLLKKQDQNDTRENTALNKALKKMWPDANYNQFTAEERKRRNEWIDKVPQDRLEALNKNMDYVEQIAQLQYIPKSILPAKMGQPDSERVRLFAHFKARAIQPKIGYVTLKERISPDWVAVNFDPQFIAFVMEEKGRWVNVPVGNSREDKAPKYLRSTVCLAYGKKNEYLHYIQLCKCPGLHIQ
jgi:hypothetical protein